MGYDVAIFSEAGSMRGMGHLVRTYTIANKLKKRNCNISYFLDSDIRYSNYDEINYFNWNDFRLNKQYDIIIIDSYEANINIYYTIEKKSKIAVYIDDYNRLNYPRGIIVNFAPEAKKYFNLSSKIHTFLLGLDYVPIREIFLKKYIKKQKHIFIMLGGADIKNLSIKIIEYLKDIDILKIVVANNMATKNKLQHYKNIKILYKPKDHILVQYMSSSILVILTASMSVYESACLQIPTIIIAVSKNQTNGVKQFLQYGLAILFININNKSVDKIFKKEVAKYIANPYKVPKVIDGNGTSRICTKIIKLLK
jgi:spore coat polysaccharide biosynthesis predicted glycosyltransferase SpsG